MHLLTTNRLMTPTVRMNKILECLAQCNVLAKLKGLIELTLINTGARV